MYGSMYDEHRIRNSYDADVLIVARPCVCARVGEESWPQAMAMTLFGSFTTVSVPWYDIRKCTGACMMSIVYETATTLMF